MPKRKRYASTLHNIHKAVLETKSTRPAVVARALPCEIEELNSLLVLSDTTCEKLLQLDEQTAAALFKEQYEVEIETESRLMNMTLCELQQKIKACHWRIELTNYLLVTDYRLLSTLKMAGTSYDELKVMSERDMQIKFGDHFHKTINELLQINASYPDARQFAQPHLVRKQAKLDSEAVKVFYLSASESEPVIVEQALTVTSPEKDTISVQSDTGLNPQPDPAPVTINAEQDNAVNTPVTELAGISLPEPEALPSDAWTEIKKTKSRKHRHRHHRHQLTKNISYVISGNGRKVKIHYPKEMSVKVVSELIKGRIRTRPECDQYIRVKQENKKISIVMVKNAVFPEGVTFKTAMKSLKEDRRGRRIQWDWYALSTSSTNENDQVIVENKNGNYTLRTIAVQLRKIICKDSEVSNKRLTIKQNKKENNVTVLLKPGQCLPSGLSLRSYLELLMYKDILYHFHYTVESGIPCLIENAWRNNHTLHSLIKSINADDSKCLLKQILALASEETKQFIFDYLSWLDNENLMIEVLHDIYLEWGVNGDQPDIVRFQVGLLQESLHQLSKKSFLHAGEEGDTLFDLRENDCGAESVEESVELTMPGSPSLTLFGHSYLSQIETDSFQWQWSADELSQNDKSQNAGRLSSIPAALFNDSMPETTNDTVMPDHHADNNRIFK